MTTSNRLLSVWRGHSCPRSAHSPALSQVEGSIRATRFLRLLALLFFFIVAALAQAPAPAQNLSPVDPLPQDTGTAGLKQMLLRLHTTARMLHTTAHPDDEDGGMLTLESRGKGVTAILLTLNRGEGGQNKVGSNLFDVLGVVRTLELTASDRYYGVEQRFTRVADFGFSKNADETFQKWGGHDIVLGDMVRVIRTFRPDVIVSRFGGTDRDGHGNHQASGIVSKEAFRAAADPKRFPEQIKEGLLPWQAKKLYTDNVCGFRAETCPDKDWTIKLNVGEPSPALGMSYAEFAMQGLKHQLSQGAGGWSLTPGPHYEFYRLIDSILPRTTDKDGHEKDFFDGIDITLPGLLARAGSESAKVSFLKSGLLELQARVDQATVAADKNTISAAEPLLDGLQLVTRLIKQVNDSPLSPSAKDDLLVELKTKEEQFAQAADLAAGTAFSVAADVPVAANPDDAFMAVPGQTFEISAIAKSSDPQLKFTSVDLDVPHGWSVKGLTRTPSDGIWKFSVSVPEDAQYTRPYWHRDNPETDSLNTVDQPAYATLPFPPPPVQAHAIYVLHGKQGLVSAVCMVRYKEADGKEAKRALAVAPPFSIELEPSTEVIPTSDGHTTQIRVNVRSNIATSGEARLRLELPSGWRSDPASQSLSFQHAGESKDLTFQVRPSALQEGHAEIRASLDYRGDTYNLGYTVVDRPDLDTFYYYQPATQRVSIVDVKIPHDLKVGYIMGAGDDIATVLKQIGMDVTPIAAESLTSADLSQYGTIVLGIRAYDTQKDVASNNKKLLDYVDGGGTLVVQYNASTQDFNSGHFTPYPAQLSRARVSVEEAPVEILAPDDSIFHYPNQITRKDFDGWVQERGLYFMSQWDDRFKPLLSCHDPGEEPQKGGLLRAQYGKGTYIYTGYAFFRQLPVGVPGAIRLYGNLLSAGHEKQAAGAGF
jgi:LmbE family N-acetylglucosaminyl deacetylase